jgi:hypothetical protein
MKCEVKIEAEDLRTKLHEGVVQFSFKKKDGSIREAVGTTLMSSIPEDIRPVEKGESREYTPNPDQIRYFDLEKAGWRSIGAAQEIWIK